jgi:hypothetical protein
MTTTIVTRELVPVHQRGNHVDDLFGIHFPMQLEPYIFGVASELSPDYNGGYWEFYALSNGGFYMMPDAGTPFTVICPNGYDGVLSADAFGVTSCLYAYSRLSFIADRDVAEVYARQYHLLREYMMEHAEESAILRAID